MDDLCTEMEKENIYDQANWHNSNNEGYYNSLLPAELQDIAVRGGLDTCCDVHELKKYIDDSQSILELGAGYGRVMDAIIHMGYKGKLYAIERNEYFHSLLKMKLSGKVDIQQADLRTFEPTGKFDLILWMWTGISEFSPEEQYLMLNKFFSFLTDFGRLIVDVVPITPTSQFINAGKQITNQHLMVLSHAGKPDFCYMPSQQEMKKNADLIGATLDEIKYKTTTDREHVFYVFSK